MPSLRDIRVRVKSVANTRKITKAQEMVAAAKMRRAIEHQAASRPYVDELTNVVAELIGRNPQHTHPFLERRAVRNRLIILVTSDRGLCGALNSHNIRLVAREIRASGSVPVYLVTIGRRGRDAMRRANRTLVADMSQLGDRPTIGDVLPAIRVAMGTYASGKADQVDVVFARFVTAGKQVATMHRVLPLDPPQATDSSRAADFTYEPEPKEVLEALLPRYVEARVYQAVLENLASEQAARMVAMRNASDNATDLIEDLTLTGNKLRQSTITTELIEVVSGAAALEG
jgi:F-type H+-transporting ATPase subunit gamma